MGPISCIVSLKFAPAISFPSSLVPHAVCWAADPRLIWTMAVTDLITFVSYLTICLTLFYLARRTKGIFAKDWAFFVVGFALFILACGVTHLMELITTWVPIFWVDAWANIVTAVLSAWVAATLIQRASRISVGIQNYATRLLSTEVENRKLQQSLIDAQKLEDWSRISASVSHEIKNPLQAIQNLQYLIRGADGVSEEVVELARLAEEEARRVVAIADATLSFIRQTSQAESVDLSAVVESIRFLLNPIVNRRGIVFAFDHKGDCHVEAFAGEVRQVLLNVIRNACEAIETPGAQVSVSLAGKQAGVEVVISDEGAGIAPGILPRIFEFGASTKGDAGNGMGLWTAKHILEKHRGEIEVHTQRGEGTRIKLWWPREYREPSNL